MTKFKWPVLRNFRSVLLLFNYTVTPFRSLVVVNRIGICRVHWRFSLNNYFEIIIIKVFEHLNEHCLDRTLSTHVNAQLILHALKQWCHMCGSAYMCPDPDGSGSKRTSTLQSAGSQTDSLILILGIAGNKCII